MMHFPADTHSAQEILSNFGHSIVQFAASADSGDDVTICYYRDALIELGVMLLTILRKYGEKKSS